MGSKHCKSFYRQVLAMHRAWGEPVGEQPHDLPWDRKRLRVTLLAEEVAELVCALAGVQGRRAQRIADMIVREYDELTEEVRANPDFVGADVAKIAQEAVDVHVVTSGLLVEMGVDEDGVAWEVHEANMAKADGPRRADGKRLKPAGWRPPDVARALGLPHDGNTLRRLPVTTFVLDGQVWSSLGSVALVHGRWPEGVGRPAPSSSPSSVRLDKLAAMLAAHYEPISLGQPERAKSPVDGTTYGWLWVHRLPDDYGAAAALVDVVERVVPDGSWAIGEVDEMRLVAGVWAPAPILARIDGEGQIAGLVASIIPSPCLPWSS